MEEFKLNDDVFEQTKNFPRYWDLTKKQKSLIDKLILNEELKDHFKWYGLCTECKQPNTDECWYQSCTSISLFKEHN